MWSRTVEKRNWIIFNLFIQRITFDLVASVILVDPMNFRSNIHFSGFLASSMKCGAFEQKHWSFIIYFFQAWLLGLWPPRPQWPPAPPPRPRLLYLQIRPLLIPISLLNPNGYTVSIASLLSVTLGTWWFMCRPHTCWTFTNWPTLQSCKMWVFKKQD